MTKISVIDTETVSMKGAICEFGITTFEGDQFLKVESSIGTCVNPKTPISFEAMNVHHITEEDVKDAPEINDVLKDHPLADSDYVVAHNLSYELAVLPEDYFPENVRKLCTLKLAKLLYPVGEVESHKLGVLYYQWGIYKDPRLQVMDVQLHSAKDDTIVTGLVLEYMLADNDLTIDQAWELCYDFKTCKGGKRYKSEKWEDIITKDYDYVQYTFENTELDQEELDYLEELLSKHKHLKEDQLKLCKKSKYLDIPWQKVVEDDIDYVNFLLKNNYLKGDELEYVQSLLK
jgi:DNA polymerase III epsilon subunit-like protein|tara:strand:+ start:1394 stop:2260 length:867 start_codon:yes stop_codon:yes gene_type:complete